MANWNIMQNGRHFSLANRAILIVIIHVIISSVGVHKVWGSNSNSLNCQIKTTTKCTTYMVFNNKEHKYSIKAVR